jgi:hypothetical protein
LLVRFLTLGETNQFFAKQFCAGGPMEFSSLQEYGCLIREVLFGVDERACEPSSPVVDLSGPGGIPKATIIGLSQETGVDWMATGMTQTEEQVEFSDALRPFHTETGWPLLELVDESPVLLVFLRHFACAFCAQTLDRVSQVRQQIEAKGVRPVFVHLGSPERAKPYFDYYHISDIERISNPEATLYQLPLFGLGRTNPFSHFLNPTVLRGWLKGAMFKYGIGMIQEDAEQMPGVFLLKDRKIARAFRHRTIADEPDYLKLSAG